MSNNRADLHTHTIASDGMETPAANVRLAAELGLAALAITDHDTTAGVREAMLEGERLGVHVVPGVELSTEADHTDIHLLAYYTDLDDERWQDRLQQLRNVRNVRNELIVERLRALGIDITLAEVEQQTRVARTNGTVLTSEEKSSEQTTGRPHIAQALLAKGVVTTIKEAFDRYLAQGAAAYVNPPRVHPVEAIEWVKEAGGVPVIAHPGLYNRDDLVEQLIRAGVAGIEVYHSDHEEQDIQRYGELASKYGVIATGGSDFHGFRQGKAFHGPLGSVTVDLSIVKQLREAART